MLLPNALAVLSVDGVLAETAQTARDVLGADYAALEVNGADGGLDEFVQVGCAPRVHPPMRAFLSVPITLGEQVVGSLYCARAPDREEFSLADERQALALAAHAGRAVLNARLSAEAQRRQQRWNAAASTLTIRLLSDKEAEPIDVITDEAALAADADIAILSIPHGEHQLFVRAASGVRGSELTSTSWPKSGTLASQVLASGQPVLVEDFPFATNAIGFSLGPVMVVPLVAQGHVRGVISCARASSRPRFTDSDVQSATEFARQAAVALELVEARRAERKLAVAADRERIARDLHDHIVQELFALSMGLRALACVTHEAEHVGRLNGYVDTIDDVISGVRTSIFRLQPRRHDHQGLQSRLLDLVDSYVEPLGFAARSRFRGALDLQVAPGLAEDIVAVTREGLSNAARHAQATAVDVSVTLIGDLITVQVADNGVGLGSPTRSSGLSNLRKRAEQHNGTLVLDTTEDGGTRLTWTAHCA